MRQNPLRYRGYVYDRETGFYYLQSRYYDPIKGRFISPDAFVSTGQGILGYNMFAYCLNNPVNFIDSAGNMAMKRRAILFSSVTLLQENATTPESINATVVVGVGGGVSLGPWTFAAQLGVAADLNDNVELQFTYSVPFSTATPSTDEMMQKGKLISGGLLASVTITNAPDVEKLHGLGHQTGVSLGKIAIDFNAIPNKDTTYFGVTFSGGIASPDFHHTMGYTIRVAKLNINFWNLVDAAYRGWLGVN